MMRKIIAGILVLLVVWTSCQSHKNGVASIPEEPDYQDSTQWYMTNRKADADIFYITSTETGDYALPHGATAHYADTYSDSLRAPLYGEMVGVDTLVSGRLNFISPYYRQCSLQSFENDSLKAARLPLPLGDVRRAFQYYLKHLNGGRPFILAGYSQGAYIMLELLKEMDDVTYKRMIAAYAIGITIRESHPHIVPAKGADDTGVTICYNSVRDTSCAMRGWEKSNVAINPVNWHTDSAVAITKSKTYSIEDGREPAREIVALGIYHQLEGDLINGTLRFELSSGFPRDAQIIDGVLTHDSIAYTKQNNADAPAPYQPAAK